MCVIFIAWQMRADQPLILIANRDEFYDRPTAAATRWYDSPTITAGRDLVRGGTWLGITDSGRFAAVTNYRDPSAPTGRRSRGDLVRDFLGGSMSSAEFLAAVDRDSHEFSGFNLLVGESPGALWYYSNRERRPRKLLPGIYGLSNHLLDTPWPKVRRGKTVFAALVADHLTKADNYFELLGDKTLAPDDELPETGIGYEREKLLSSIFIETPIYGTRSSTIVTTDRTGRLSLTERTFV